jgi:hypothetical protein
MKFTFSIHAIRVVPLRSRIMIRQSLIALALAGLAGCSASTAIKPLGNDTNREATAQLAAYAATARLPENAQFRNDLQVAAVIDRDTGAIHIYNFTDKPLAGGNLWINRTYVQRFNNVPARGEITLPRTRFYDRNGQSLAKVNTPADSVQLQWDNDVYSLLGPVYR